MMDIEHSRKGMPSESLLASVPQQTRFHAAGNKVKEELRKLLPPDIQLSLIETSALSNLCQHHTEALHPVRDILS